MVLLDRWTQKNAIQKLLRFAQKTPRQKLWSIPRNLGETDWYWRIFSPGNDRTAYVVGLFGSGRDYLTDLMFQHCRRRAKYITIAFRLRRCRTSMIYSGHATLKYPSRFQARPEVTSRVLEAARSGLADLIFIHRHPLDSLLTNWVWWRTFLRYKVMIRGISQVYRDNRHLCADLEQNFSEFTAFADGDPAFFAGAPGTPFLSLTQFLEETERFVECATLALRFEDFFADPAGEFSKMIRVMSIDLDLGASSVDPPRSKPDRYLAVMEEVPRLREFIDRLDPETKGRIEKLGYKVGAGSGSLRRPER